MRLSDTSSCNTPRGLRLCGDLRSGVLPYRCISSRPDHFGHAEHVTFLVVCARCFLVLVLDFSACFRMVAITVIAEPSKGVLTRCHFASSLSWIDLGRPTLCIPLVTKRASPRRHPGEKQVPHLQAASSGPPFTSSSHLPCTQEP